MDRLPVQVLVYRGRELRPPVDAATAEGRERLKALDTTTRTIGTVALTHTPTPENPDHSSE